MNPSSELQLLAGRLMTSRYHGWQPSNGVPIRTSVGTPKDWRFGPLEHVRELTPYGLLDADADVFDDLYRRRLDYFAGRVVAKLADLARKYPGEPLVLLCFEDVIAGKGCHRRDFAEWFQHRFDIEVPELGRHVPPPSRLW